MAVVYLLPYMGKWDFLKGQTTERVCLCCNELKPLTTEFFREAWDSVSLRRTCKKCENLHQNSAKFGLSGKHRRSLMTAATHCPICQCVLEESKQGVAGAKLSRTAVVDHDHTTGQFRGILCNTCNRGIGLLGDDVDNLKRAITYLQGG